MITNVITQQVGQEKPTSVTQILQCEANGCTNHTSYDILSQGSKEEAIAKSPWVRTYRTVQTGDGRSFGYCGDLCEIAAIGTGQHNIPEPKRVETNANPAAIAAAAAAAANAKKSDEALRSGAGGTIQITDN